MSEIPTPCAYCEVGKLGCALLRFEPVTRMRLCAFKPKDFMIATGDPMAAILYPETQLSAFTPEVLIRQLEKGD